ncbi:hypothetical protein GCM10023211_23950 [Orbus sasakiae]|uniref:DUF4123 domain-containing protein n=1 Tax=Orbus sasakiae TaxID=1078475 RepID=A0ABP9NE63_9GAMM
MTFDYSENMRNEQLNMILSTLRAINDNSAVDMAFYLLYHPQAGSEINDVVAAWQAHQPYYPIKYSQYTTEYTPAIIQFDLNNVDHQKILSDSVHQALLEIEPNKLSQFNPRKIYGWLWSSLPAEQLAKQIGYIAIQSRGQHQELIRYFDSAIFPAFMSILNGNQQDKVLRPVSDWYYLDGDGQLQHKHNRQMIRKHITPDLALSNEQWSMIDDIVIHNQILIRYREQKLTEKRLTENECNKILTTVLIQAKAAGYTDFKDLVEYGYYSMSVHPNIMLHEKIIKIKMTNQTEQLKTSLAKLSEQDWQMMKQQVEGINND